MSEPQKSAPAWTRDYVPVVDSPPGAFERIKSHYFQNVVLPTMHVAGYERAMRVASWLGRFLYDRMPAVRRSVLPPLRDALGHRGSVDLETLARESVAHAMSTHVVIAFIERLIRAGTWARRIRVLGAEPILEAVRAGRGVVIAGADFGENEVGMTAAGYHFGGRVAVIVNPFQSAIHQRWMAYMVRRRLATLYPRLGAVANSRTALRRGQVLFMIGHYLGERGRGVTLTFLGRRATYYPTAATLAARTHCPLAVVTCVRTDGPNEFELRVREFFEPPAHAPLEWIDDATRRTLSAFESAILERPVQFAWFRQPADQAAGPEVI